MSLYDQEGIIKGSSSKLAELIVKATVASRGRAPPCTYELRNVQPDGRLKVMERFTCGGAATMRDWGRGRVFGSRGRRGGSNKGSSSSSSGSEGGKHNPNQGDGSDGGKSSKSGAAAAESSYMRSTTVDLLGGGDGQSALLEAARCWNDDDDGGGGGGEVKKSTISTKKTNTTKNDGGGPPADIITPSQLEEWMTTRGAMLPSIEVTVVFGRHFHVSGYPPWQLHKTELYHVSSLWSFSRKGLTNVLRKYSKVSQRFGK